MNTEHTSPKTIATGFRDAWNAHDANAIADLFIDDAAFVNVTGLWWNTKEQIRKAHAFGFERIFGKSTLTLGRTEVRMLNEEHAIVHARITIRGQRTPNGDVADDRRTIFSFVVEKQHTEKGKEFWLAVSAHNTDIAPGGMDTHLNQGPTQTAVSYR